MLAEHFAEEHLDDGANESPQYYAIQDVRFETFEEYKVCGNLLGVEIVTIKRSP